ncbi:hypothetical protein N656DRAFT_510967 [Canariomyces notabilis]|uniref:Uncharacterized protein n=1 Tax=Canariomyces notabilis TaxID=2074819 RepID=A0AAN6QD45_9PEZI|nr:hypothetical protein N656DRAFT_510967 [Canariomyces arenarius]
MLRRRVDRELANLESLLHELEVTPMRIEAQRASVDSYMNLVIATNSQITATASLVEGRIMRTIAVVTFVFLSGTFVTAIFSMSIFNWSSDGAADEPIVSRYIWVYVLITVLLTSCVILG